MHNGAANSALPISDLYRIRPPPYRHALPSAPWPWIDIHDSINEVQLKTGAPPVPPDCDHNSCDGKCWKGYPQSRFPNWTRAQVEKCKIRMAVDNYDHSSSCSVAILDVTKRSIFKDAGELVLKYDQASLNKQWNWFKDHRQGPDIRIRALFVNNMCGPILKMLGGRYNIEPFFFSCSLNRIPTWFQEDLRENIGDHITVTLPFIQLVPGHLVSQNIHLQRPSDPGKSTINTQLPLRISLKRSRQRSTKAALLRECPLDEYALALNLVSLHLIRNVDGNTLISYHANTDLPTTTASYLHERIRLAGQSVYWQKMLKNAEDPTLLLLIFIWQAAYAWDEALQHLDKYIIQMESEMMYALTLELTRQLHTVRAHQLHYNSLLHSFERAVRFVRDTRNPSLTEQQLATSQYFVERECNILLKEIERMDSECTKQENRLKNVMNLVVKKVTIHDGEIMKKLTAATIRNGAAMKQISFLAVIFLPASLVTSIFGTNIQQFAQAAQSYPKTTSHFIVTMTVLVVSAILYLVLVEKKLS